MAKKITLETLDRKFDRLLHKTRVNEGTRLRVGRGDIANLATKEQLIDLYAHMVAIETELRDSKRHKLVTRVADLQDKDRRSPRLAKCELQSAIICAIADPHPAPGRCGRKKCWSTLRTRSSCW